ncbi:unnamed protein product [Jaminaea pallidilutea]
MVHHTLTTPDGFPLSVDSFAPTDDAQVQASCVIINATGVQARFYHDFAQWLSKHGVAVLTLDFRFSGSSLPAEVLSALQAAKGDEVKQEEIFHDALVSCPEQWALMSHWTQLDVATVVRYSRERWSNKPLTLLGNSLGGHLATLLDEAITFDSSAPVRVLNVCGGNAYWRNNPRPAEARYAFDELIVKPLETDRVFRASALGLGYDLPYGVGRDWLRWFYHPLFSLQGVKDEQNARSVGRRLQSYLYVGFEDDESISHKMMLQHLSLFDLSRNNFHSLWIDPPKNKPIPWPKCGHVTSMQPTKTSDTDSDDGDDDAEDGNPLPTGAEGYQEQEEREDREEARQGNEDALDRQDAKDVSSSSLSTHSESYTPRPSSAEPGHPQPAARLTRQDTIFSLYLDFILHGRVWRHAGEFKAWRKEDERDGAAIRKEEDRIRLEARSKGKRMVGDYDADEGDGGSDDQRSGADADGDKAGARRSKL